MTHIATYEPISVPSVEVRTSVIVSVKTRLVGPDTLRALAILLVMLVHIPVEATPSFLVGVRNYAWLGVDIFFVLSGYLIGTQLFKEIGAAGRIDFKSFYLRRAFRIFPAFFVVLAAYALFPIVRDSANMQPLWSFATFTVNFGFDPREGNAFSQAWSLCVEEHFYLILPLLLLAFRGRLGMKTTLWLVASLVATGIIVRFALWEGEVRQLVEAAKFREAFAVYLRDVYYPSYTRIDGLLFGVLLAAARFYKPEHYRRYAHPSVAIPVGIGLVAVALYVFSLRGPLEGSNVFPVFQAELGAVLGFPIISMGIALLLGAMLDLEPELKGWSIPGTAMVATLSYSLYLTHKSTFHIDRVLFGKENLEGGLGFLVYLSTSFVVAAVLWFCVERTFLMIRDRVLTKR
ncbi:acyltransferase [Rhizobium sp. FKL33]|uniref:acyltransferase family protein n=1 Tax=Rhizobium sp. FKL33 TaxID=2562307 RepID=UPI0010BF926C|nr:acyltransferase [Rhizobium sp. FKL33]